MKYLILLIAVCALQEHKFIYYHHESQISIVHVDELVHQELALWLGKTVWEKALIFQSFSERNGLISINYLNIGEFLDEHEGLHEFPLDYIYETICNYQFKGLNLTTSGTIYFNECVSFAGSPYINFVESNHSNKMVWNVQYNSYERNNEILVQNDQPHVFVNEHALNILRFNTPTFVSDIEQTIVSLEINNIQYQSMNLICRDDTYKIVKTNYGKVVNYGYETRTYIIV